MAEPPTGNRTESSYALPMSSTRDESNGDWYEMYGLVHMGTSPSKRTVRLFVCSRKSAREKDRETKRESERSRSFTRAMVPKTTFPLYPSIHKMGNRRIFVLALKNKG